MYVDWLFSVLWVHSDIHNISLPPKQPLSVLAAPAFYSDCKKRQEMPCELWTVGTWHRSVCYITGPVSGLRQYGLALYTVSHLLWDFHSTLECHMMMCTGEHWRSLNTSVLICPTAVTSHNTMIVTFKSSLLLLHSGTFTVPAES
jgi:hypothetical protein